MLNERRPCIFVNERSFLITRLCDGDGLDLPEAKVLEVICRDRSREMPVKVRTD